MKMSKLNIYFLTKAVHWILPKFYTKMHCEVSLLTAKRKHAVIWFHSHFGLHYEVPVGLYWGWAQLGIATVAAPVMGRVWESGPLGGFSQANQSGQDWLWSFPTPRIWGVGVGSRGRRPELGGKMGTEHAPEHKGKWGGREFLHTLGTSPQSLLQPGMPLLVDWGKEVRSWDAATPAAWVASPACPFDKF